MPQDAHTKPPSPARPSRSIEREDLVAWMQQPGVADGFRRLFPAVPTHFNKLHYMAMRNLLVRTDCGPSDDEVRALLSLLADLGIVDFKDDLVIARPVAAG